MRTHGWTYNQTVNQSEIFDMRSQQLTASQLVYRTRSETKYNELNNKVR